MLCLSFFLYYKIIVIIISNINNKNKAVQFFKYIIKFSIYLYLWKFVGKIKCFALIELSTLL